MKVYRVQDAQGRGPWKPGFSTQWVADRTEEQFARLAPGLSLVRRGMSQAIAGAHHAFGCESLEQMREWFWPVEYRFLLDHGYRAVIIYPVRVLARDSVQCLFESAKPLADAAIPFDLYAG